MSNEFLMLNGSTAVLYYIPTNKEEFILLVLI